jgi:glycerophosphoryl diester phosphodiesterase
MWIMICKADNLHIHYDFLDSWIVRWARFKGMRVNCYTINNGTIYKKFDGVNIDGVFTDNIESLK